MKKLIAILLVALMCMGMVACGGNVDTESDANNDSAVVTPEIDENDTDSDTDSETADTDNNTDTDGSTDPDTPVQSPEQNPDPTPVAPAPSTGIATSLDLLTSIWGAFPDDAKFAIGGGLDGIMDAPGSFNGAEAETLDAVLGVPADAVAYFDDAASMMHMMNANNFTCGAYRLTDKANLGDFEKLMTDHINARQWICGFPERLVCISYENYMIVAFGAEDIINNLITYSQSALGSGAVVEYNEPIA